MYLIENNRIIKKLLNEKEYEKIYEYFGRNIYNFIVPLDYQKQDILKLMDEKRYGEIYNKYGKVILIFFKEFYKNGNNDICEKIEDGKYEDIYREYGDEVYNNSKIISTILEDDVYNETESEFKAKLYKSKYVMAVKLKSLFNSISIAAVSSALVLGQGIAYTTNQLYDENLVTYSKELTDYNKKIDEYAEYINSLNLNDLQTIMKVIDDTWNDVDGYGAPKLDIYGLYRLDYLESNGVGVCRNFADDFTAKMNAINPEYDARNIVVYMDQSEYTTDSIANIDIHTSSSYTPSNEETTIDFSKITGNHMVSVLKPINSNYYIVVDSTNPSIGIINNGNIYMFSTIDGKGLTYRSVGEYLMGVKDEVTSLNKIFASSIFNSFSDEKIKELNNQYGVDAQNEALNYVRSLKRIK